jgi:hypothetical protein
VNEQLAAVSQSLLQHDLKHWVRRHEAALAEALPLRQIAFAHLADELVPVVPRPTRRSDDAISTVNPSGFPKARYSSPFGGT